MIIKTFVDREKVKSMLNLIKSREEFVSSVDFKKFSTIVAENYYEIIKELATALLILDGLKAIGEYAHKETLDNLSKHKEFLHNDIIISNDLRIKRNRSSYEGKSIPSEYIENNKDKLVKIIDKLKGVVMEKLE